VEGWRSENTMTHLTTGDALCDVWFPLSMRRVDDEWEAAVLSLPGVYGRGVSRAAASDSAIELSRQVLAERATEAWPKFVMYDCFAK
jgi:hypothetical protein